MTTAITANIGTAASAAVASSVTNNPAQSVQAASGAQAAQLSQAAAQQAPRKPEANDKRRGVQVPKRAEAVFAPQTTKAVPGRNTTPEKEEKKNVFADTNRLNIKI